MPHPPTDPTIEQKYMGIVFGAQMNGFSGEILNSFTPTSTSYCGYNRNPTKMGLVFHSTWHLRIVGRCRRLVVKLASAFFFFGTSEVKKTPTSRSSSNSSGRTWLWDFDQCDWCWTELKVFLGGFGVFKSHTYVDGSEIPKQPPGDV